MDNGPGIFSGSLLAAGKRSNADKSSASNALTLPCWGLAEVLCQERRVRASWPPFHRSSSSRSPNVQTRIRLY
jgi:hypothetical protein